MSKLPPEMVETVCHGGASTRAEANEAPRFLAGDVVLARNINPRGHTRLPRYARGRRGVVECDRGAFTFPDTNAHAQGTRPQHLYSVKFSAQELWGAEASPTQSIYLDLFDDYLSPG
jgi:nitrile hydratase